MRTFSSVSLVLLSVLAVAACAGSHVRSQDGLWPMIQPFVSGHLRVSDIHQIYYEACGNPDGVPLFFVHGGPGGSSSTRMRRLADPDTFMIVQHDQRGAGRSQPFAEVRENTTPDLVEDIERLRNHLGVGKVVLVGGSWGTTLALAYAETYPGNVAGMILRGVFTATGDEIDNIFHGGAAAFFPQAYDELLSSLPDPDTRPLPPYIYRLLTEGDPTTRNKVSHAFARYTARIAAPHRSQQEVDKLLDASNTFIIALFESYYMSHHGFLDDGQILRDADRIATIPAVIINGRHDVICPPATAFRLHQRLPRSTLHIIEDAGHSHSEPGVEQALVAAIASFEAAER